MTLTITLELAPEIEAKLRNSLTRKDAATAQQVLAEAVAPTVIELLQKAEAAEPTTQNPADLSAEEFETLLEHLLAETDRMIPPGTPPLSDYALSRESFYEGHPKF